MSTLAYQHQIWDYKKADLTNIRKALDLVNQAKLFDQKDNYAQVTILNKIILNIFRNYVPNKYITVNDEDPAWMNKNIKSRIKSRNLAYRQYMQKSKFENGFVLLETFITELNESISSTNSLYYENIGNKLFDPLLQANTYSSILKTFYNKKKNPANSTSFGKRQVFNDII